MRRHWLKPRTTERTAHCQFRPKLDRLEPKLAPTVFTVTNTNDSGAGSLRNAILAANGGGLDEIHFNIPGAGVHTITPLSQLPSINDPVVIEGYTQPGASANTNGPSQADNAVLQIEINGANGNQNGLVLSDTADGSTVRGLVIDNGFSFGILIGANNVTVEGCFIGVDPTGTKAQANGNGIGYGFGQDTANGLIGGTTPAARNVISGNGHGIFIFSGNQTIQGNLIGTDVSGLVGIANEVGVEIQASGGHLIGGATAVARNVINGHSSAVRIASNASANKIQGNFIQVLIDGLTPGDVPFNGISIDTGSTDIEVGGPTSTPGTGLGNVIGACGIGIQAGGSNHKIQGNLIGTDATGTKALGIAQNGIALFGNASTTIGGPTVDTRNIIAACGGFAIQIDQGLTSTPPSNNLVQNNFIGTNINGVLNSMGNGGGVLLQSSQNGTNNQLLSNVIAGNAGSGVVLRSGATNTAIQGNSIFSNGGLGMDLGGGTQDAFGVTANDPGDGDTGPNGLQNYPVIASSVISAGNFNITGTLNSTPNTTFQLEFFAGAAADPSGFGEGQSFLGSKTVTTDANGDVSFTATLPVAAGVGRVISATATDSAGNTSEFSAARPTLAPPILAAVIVNSGAVQRSRVTAVEVNFDQIVSLPATPASAFSLKRQGDNAVVNLAAKVDNSGSGTKVTLTFTGGAVDNISLKDGRYTLTALAAQIGSTAGQMDGNGDGAGGDDFVLVGDPATNKLFRLFGDSDGDGNVSIADFAAFRGAFNDTSTLLFDSDGDGDVDLADFAAFRQRFGVMI